MIVIIQAKSNLESEEKKVDKKFKKQQPTR